MGRKINRLLIFVVSCSVVGLALGATASQAELDRCLGAATPTSNCLTEDPLLNKVEGMGVGLLAGAGAALGATWQLWQNKK